MAKAPKDDGKKEEQVITPLDQIKAYLAAHEEDHYNFVKATDYTVSSGSLKLDIEMGGGIHPGILRFTGVTEGGKTSCSLAFARNFQKSVPNSMVIYIRAEGRLSNDVLIRSGIDTDPKKWFVYKSNVYESVLELINELIFNNPTDVKYMFILDSMDSMIPRGDVNKGYDQNNRVAGAAALSSDFLRKMSNPISSFGHICAMISQVRSNVKINPYEKGDPKITNASGGNALLHYSDWILEFQPRYKDDLITTEPDGKGDILGHDCKIIFRKTPNEKTSVSVRYPIRHGRINGESVWCEREVAETMKMFDFLKKNGSWLTIDPGLIKELKDKEIDCPTQVQGFDKFVGYLEGNKKMTDYLYKKFCNVLQRDTAA